jgi:hypothetical protein
MPGPATLRTAEGLLSEQGERHAQAVLLQRLDRSEATDAIKADIQTPQAGTKRRRMRWVHRCGHILDARDTVNARDTDDAHSLRSILLVLDDLGSRPLTRRFDPAFVGSAAGTHPRAVVDREAVHRGGVGFD